MHRGSLHCPIPDALLTVISRPTHPGGSPHPAPRPGQTSRMVSIHRFQQTGPCVLSETFSWLTLRCLLCKASGLAARKHRTHRRTWKGFLGHDDGQVPGSDQHPLTGYGCAISELKPPSCCCRTRESSIPRENRGQRSRGFLPQKLQGKGSRGTSSWLGACARQLLKWPPVIPTP